MKKLLILLIIICTSSCVAPYSSYDYNTPRYTYYPYTYHQPTKVIVVKQKHYKHKSNKRHIKVKINKHRKTK